MSSPKPVILLIHGGWHFPIHYSPFLSVLESQDYRVVAPELPSVGDSTPPDPARADISLIAETARGLVDDGNEVVAVAHSYGGVVATEALSGLGIRERKQKGLPGGVKRIFFVTAFILTEGVTLDSLAPAEKSGGLLRYEDGLKIINPDMDVGGILYSDLSRDEQQKWVKLIGKHPESLSYYLPTNFAYREIDTTYVYADKDGAVPVFAQKALVDAVKAQGVEVSEESLPSSHFPFLSMPEKLAEVVLKYN